MIFQIWGPLKAIVSRQYLTLDLCLDASILGFLKSKGSHLFETLRSLLVQINYLKFWKFQWEKFFKFLMCIAILFAIWRSSEKLEL